MAQSLTTQATDLAAAKMAAVNEFIMTIGERRIRGIIRERQEAEQIYQEAKRQGYPDFADWRG